MRARAIAAILACILLLEVFPAACADSASGVWSFRNGFGGHFPDAQPPAIWAPGQNIAWMYPLKKRSNASPIVVGNKIYVLEEPSTLICLDSAGKLLWQRTHSRADVLGAEAAGTPPPAPEWLETYGFTTPTPVSDGRRVWCVFGHGLVVCYDLDGRRLWAQSLDVSDNISGVAVSPCLAGNVLIAGGKGKDRLCGFDALTGRKLWSSEEGSQEGSCVPLAIDGRTLVLASAGLIFDPQTGAILQRGLLGEPFKGDASRQPINWGPTVVVEGGVAFFHVHFQPDQYNTALRAVKIDPPRSSQRWNFQANKDGDIRGRMGNSPVVHQGLLYAVKDSGLLQVIDTQSGMLVYSQKLPKQSYASLALAGTHLYAFGGSNVTIFKPGRTYEQAAQFPHGFHDFIASPVFHERRLYFRDGTGLWCIEAPQDSPQAGAPALVAAPAPPMADEGPDLADSAKNAPLISYVDWLLQYDYSRDRIRRLSAICEWCLALILFLGSAWWCRASGRKPDWRWFALFLIGALLTLPWLGQADRAGNAHWPVLLWCAAGALFSLRPAEDRHRCGPRQEYHRRRRASMSPAVSFVLGWILGSAAGLLAHCAPLFAVLAWYVLTGWQS